MAKAYVKRELATGKWYTDVDGGDTPAGGGIDYSTEEQDTGLKWIDEKAVYCKTFSVEKSAPAMNTLINLDDLTTLGIDSIVKFEGYMHAVKESPVTDRYEAAGLQLTFVYKADDKSLNAIQSVSSSMDKIVFICTLYYTKVD